jgi:hypothetical protein
MDTIPESQHEEDAHRQEKSEAALNDLSFATLQQEGLLLGMAEIAPFPLRHSWTLFIHEINNTDWSNASYVRQGTFDTLQGFCVCTNTVFYGLGEDNRRLPGSFKASHMFFCMKDNIFPSWESQPDGGVWTFTVAEKDLEAAWEAILFAVVGGTVPTEHVNGLQINPKPKGIYQIRLWTDHARDEELEKETFKAIEHVKTPMGKPSFRAWLESYKS